MGRKGYDTDVTNAEWALLAPLVQRKGSMGRPVKLDLRQIVNALFYWERTGCHWRLIPNDFPNWTSVRYYFDTWTRDGTWIRINATLRREVRKQAGKHAEPSAGVLDSQRVKTTESGGERGYDAGKKGQGSFMARYVCMMGKRLRCRRAHAIRMALYVCLN